MDDSDDKLTNEVKDIYCPAERISEIQDVAVEMRIIDDNGFFDQMKIDLYLRNTVKYLFENARRHDVVEEDETKMSSIMHVTRDLGNRADLCCCLARAVKENKHTRDVIEKVKGEIMIVALMLEPFVLTKEDCEKNSAVKYSHFETISCLFRMVKQALNDVIEYQIAIKEEKEKEEKITAHDGTDKHSEGKGEYM
jgi:hypothetical protein